MAPELAGWIEAGGERTSIATNTTELQGLLEARADRTLAFLTWAMVVWNGRSGGRGAQVSFSIEGSIPYPEHCGEHSRVVMSVESKLASALGALADGLRAIWSPDQVEVFKRD